MGFQLLFFNFRGTRETTTSHVLRKANLTKPRPRPLTGHSRLGALPLNPSLGSFLLVRQAGALEVAQAGHEPDCLSLLNGQDDRRARQGPAPPTDNILVASLIPSQPAADIQSESARLCILDPDKELGGPGRRERQKRPERRGRKTEGQTDSRRGKERTQRTKRHTLVNR